MFTHSSPRGLHLIPALAIAAVLIFACKPAGNEPGQAVNETQYVTAAKGLNVREKPAASSRKVGGLSNSARVKITRRIAKTVTIGGTHGHWVKIEAGRVKGWVFDAYLNPKKPPGKTAKAGALSGTYVSDCDPEVTLRFKNKSQVVIKTNHCEGYDSETWNYKTENGVLTMISTTANEPFRIMSDGSLKYMTKEYSMISCGNCKAGDLWKKK